MDITDMLENLALYTRHHAASQQLLQSQSEVVKRALALNDTKTLQAQISSDTNFAHETLVVQV